MKVSELFYRLSVGELSNLAMSNEGNGEIRQQDQGKLLVYTNAALMAVHKRFVLNTKEVLIETIDHIVNYHLKVQFALSSNSTERNKYIIDSVGSPFTGDVIRILEVYDAMKWKLPLNDPGHSESLFTPGPNVLQVPNPINRMALSVMYQANHDPLEFLGLKNEEVLAQHIEMPEFLESALLNHVAYKVFSHLNGAEHQSKAQEYIAMYEAECSEIEENDLIGQSQSTTQTKLQERGFV